ncbi:1-acylglycerol-3-phosphate O-acyltransferase Pnpla3-like isoform X2 [Eriocheir sinensis]|uniref:1-acylglycerol-3-phosphate O-acyltransferase Pnpla3-like isoform X2 n=1 Tax=Eriocheir sinensis TaxID=95602 RepID=UPI0021C5D3A1|nr:1-acylglycerol-3-phosphate O-acyltransferase Pnpla3-like isoform X2 [Eriocheir sinensis]
MGYAVLAAVLAVMVLEVVVEVVLCTITRVQLPSKRHVGRSHVPAAGSSPTCFPPLENLKMALDKEKMNFSFAGCGFLGIYHVGVAACLKKYAPNLLVNKISGASAGALAAVCLLCDSPLGIITSSVLKTATEARRCTLGPFSPTFNVEKLLREGLLSVLPDDAHKIVSGRLFISVTRVSDGKNILLSQFDTREELIHAILCSCWVPGFSGWVPPLCRGVRYLDGVLSDNLPHLDPHTITVSPFAGNVDICPRDKNAARGWAAVNLANTSIELSKENLYRFARILFPPHPNVLSKMCQQGFNDALDFLQRNNLISCTRCLAVQSSFNLTESPEVVKVDHEHHGPDDNCNDCSKQRKEAILDQLPEAVGSILQDAINKANTELTNWVFKHKSMKLLSILTLPYVLPMDIAYSAYLRFMQSAPTATGIQSLAKQVIALVKTLLRTTSPASLLRHPHHRHRHVNDTKFSCQLAITQFSGDVEAQHVHNKQNFDFTLDLDTMEGMPQSHIDAMALESQALAEVALRCASRSVSRAASRMPSRAPSRAPSRGPSRAVSRAVSRRPSVVDLPDLSNLEAYSTESLTGEDAFERILDVTTHQEALMAYYYLDDNNEVRVTEIFDMTNASDEVESEQDSDLHHLHHSHHSLQPPHWSPLSRLNSLHNRLRTTSIGSDFELEDEGAASVSGSAEGSSPHTTPSDTESEYCRRLPPPRAPPHTPPRSPPNSFSEDLFSWLCRVDAKNPESDQLFGASIGH